MGGEGGAMIFQDRREAGRALARALRQEPDLGDAIVLALPGGGVPVAFEVASELRLPLDVFVVRKLGVPAQEELALGAVASGGVVVLNESVVRAFAIPQRDIDALVARERLEIERRESLYRGGRPPLSIAGHPVIVVDDGLATGSTMTAAIRALRPQVPITVVAVPVGSSRGCEDLRGEADRVICLASPEPFHAVGEFYRQFEQVPDADVASLLAQAGSGVDSHEP